MARHAAAQKHLHKKKPRGAFDYLLYFFMVATPLFELPQALTIYRSGSAKNVSIYTWSFFVMSSIVWAVYSLRNKLYPFVVTYTMYAFIEGIIVIGIVIHS
ncbi:MAG TPA: PQ-loop domain-containing transporter [Candidatus Saccharimonadales bacterium]|jgi:uncharacterized protein with PQ loop repeat|nr:PQ-loop domain-containing transporter [Candidatus Saccharimonadales bacterium]